jgi:hypothetical protein
MFALMTAGGIFMVTSAESFYGDSASSQVISFG